MEKRLGWNICKRDLQAISKRAYSFPVLGSPRSAEQVPIGSDHRI